jgi:hypothetical protein
VRGSASCTNTPGLTDCNATNAQIQTFIQDLNYPAVVSSHLLATTTYWTASSSTPTSWTSCTSGTCNVPGNEIQVKVTYAFPIVIVFWKATTINLASTARMVISQ